MAQKKGKEKDKTKPAVAKKKTAPKKAAQKRTPKPTPSTLPVIAAASSPSPSRAPRRTYVTKTKDEIFIMNALKLKAHLEKNYVQFALVLAEIYRQRIYRSIGRVNFVEFAEVDLGWSFRKAYNYVAVGLTITNHAIDEDTAQKIGQSKMQIIAALCNLPNITDRHITAAVENALEAKTFGDFAEWADMVRGKLLLPGGTTGADTTPALRPVTIKFRIPQAELASTSRILASAKELLAQTRHIGLENIPDELVFHEILKEWAEMKGLAASGEITQTQNTNSQPEDTRPIN